MAAGQSWKCEKKEPLRSKIEECVQKSCYIGTLKLTYYFANNVVRRQQLMSTTHPDHSDYIKKFIVCTERLSNQILVIQR